MNQEKILITGALGQIGSDLTDQLRMIYGSDNVIASDIKKNNNDERYVHLDVLDTEKLVEVVKKHQITTIYHLAAMLSATAEKHPITGWELNTKSLIDILELAKAGLIKKVFWPSSIAVFGPDSPKLNTPQNAIKNPTTLYGIAKLAGEHWCNYYHLKYNVDVRGIRFPGLISYKTKPGGGTTDYSVNIFYDAILHQHYNCFLDAHATLPMLYMEDAVRATIELMQTEPDKITVRTSYNLGGLSYNPKQIAQEISKHIPNFSINYQPDYRMGIAESWPQSIDDSVATQDWGWQPKYDLQSMVVDMLKQLRLKLK